MPAAREALGWDEGWAELWRAEGAPEPVGRVARLDRGWATLWTDDDEQRVRRGELDVAVGDWAVADPGGERIAKILNRRSAFVRRAARGAKEGHVVAANVDVAALLHSLTARPSARRLERELVLAFESGAEPVVVLTKADLGKDIERAVALVRSVSPDVGVVAVSSATGQGVDELAAMAPAGRTLAVLGASGVGKSTLVNALVGHDVQRVGHVRADEKGRHTTIAAELVALPGGGLLVDTPGLRSVGLWSDSDGLDRAFADITGPALSCRFPNCRHDTEPGCAVRGHVDPARIASYRRLRAELDQLDVDLSWRR
jgi:ribosome biogenesis GTPase / thiamine phosphate phosphatase